MWTYIQTVKIHVHRHMHTDAHPPQKKRTHTRTRVRTHARMHARTHARTHTHTHTHTLGQQSWRRKKGFVKREGGFTLAEVCRWRWRSTWRLPSWRNWRSSRGWRRSGAWGRRETMHESVPWRWWWVACWRSAKRMSWKRYLMRNLFLPVVHKQHSLYLFGIYLNSEADMHPLFLNSVWVLFVLSLCAFGGGVFKLCCCVLFGGGGGGGRAVVSGRLYCCFGFVWMLLILVSEDTCQLDFIWIVCLFSLCEFLKKCFIAA